MLVAFRADASLDIGTGHVMRCLTLAKRFQRAGDECVFICREHEGNLISYLRSEGIQVCTLPLPGCEVRTFDHLAHSSWLGVSWQQDAKEVLGVASEYDFDCLVVDHYALDISWEQMLHQKIKNILVIDDLSDRAHDACALLDQNYGRKSSDYDGLLPDSCSRLIGPNFALLRPEFSELREFSFKRRSGFDLETIIVNLGGVDQDNVTGKVVDALSEIIFESELNVIVVLGATNPNVLSVISSSEASPHNVSVEVGVSNMAELMANSDLAIGAAGSTTWERFSLGVPSILLSIADNQDSALSSLSDSGYIYKLSVDSIVQDLFEFFGQKNLRDSLRALSYNGRELCDALGAEKVEVILREKCEG